MINDAFRRGLALAVACVCVAGSAGIAHAQAWVPEPGTGSLLLNYQLTRVKYHLFAGDMTRFGGDGSRMEMGKIQAQTGQLGVDYGVARNLAFTASVAYVGASYKGNAPESALLDDGKTHGALQDMFLGVRYMVPWQGFAITPNLGLTLPTHAYEHHGHAAVGKGNTSLNAGIAVGRTLAPWAPNVWMQGGYAHNFVRDVQQWGLDVNSFSGTVGWFALPQLSVSSYYTYLGTEDGIDWYSDNFRAPGVGHNHDRAAKSLARRAGGTLSYQLNASQGLFVDIGGVLSGANTHDGMSYTVGTNWSFLQARASAEPGKGGRALPVAAQEDGMSIVCLVRRIRNSLQTLAMLLVGISLSTGCSKDPTGPGGTVSGHVTLAAGQTGDVNLSVVQLYSSNPFAPGATPGQTVAATGSATDATFSFGDLGHGDFYLVAWKDDGDLIVDAGDLRGWYDGDVDGTGNPSATVLHLLHGQNASITIQVSPVP